MRYSVPVQISRFVDENQPGFVECMLVDAFGKAHVFIEKVPVVTTEDLLPTSTYPRPGILDCDIVAEWTDDSGQSLMRVDTERPWGIESTEGLTQFVLAKLDERMSASPEVTKNKSEEAERRIPPASKDFVVYTLPGLLRASKHIEYRQKCRDQALYLLRFIRNNGLNHSALPSEPIDDLVIKASDLTRDGLSTMREGLRKWVAAQDRGGVPTDLAILDAALAKVRGNGGAPGSSLDPLRRDAALVKGKVSSRVVKEAFSDAQYKLLQTLVGMSSRAHLIDRDDWMGTPGNDRERCVAAMAPMRVHWPFGAESLATFEDMLTRCLRHYEDGQLDAGDYLVRDLEEFLYVVRQKR